MNSTIYLETAKSSFYTALRLIEKFEWENAEIELKKSLKLCPNQISTLTNLCAVLFKLNKFELAKNTIRKTLIIHPINSEIYLNSGLIKCNSNEIVSALIDFIHAIVCDPCSAQAWSNLGKMQFYKKAYKQAVIAYERALHLDYSGDTYIEDLINVQMKICDWSNFQSRLKILESKILNQKKLTSPFIVLNVFDSPILQQLSAETYIKENYKKTIDLTPHINKKDKIRIAYFSMDFRDHPVSQLISDLIEVHDRSKFEVYGFSFGINTNDYYRKNFEQTFDKFYDVRNLSEHEICELARKSEVDIAIDLAGHTENSRPQIFMLRAAPIQISYLGYPGSWGSNCIDYFIADRVTIPEDKIRFFSEKIIYLPNQFQVNSRLRKISNETPTKYQYGLPENAFVFCCFNNSYKITSEVFESWMKILKHCKNSILWLSPNNNFARDNLIKFANKSGINKERIFFINRSANHSDYLSRYLAADLFLDTFPYGGHTTASDSLWAGLPLLTHAGQSFVSRVAASLLHGVDLPELVTLSNDEYTSTAVNLYNNPSQISNFKTRLQFNKINATLFKPEIFAKNIENAFREVYRRHLYGLPPVSLYF